jgi:hypothetical protein
MKLPYTEALKRIANLMKMAIKELAASEKEILS